MTYYTDGQRHLVCVPYSVANLHAMAEDLDLKRCWFHSHPTHAHYDMPKRRIAELTARCVTVSPKQILEICAGSLLSTTG